MSSVSVHVNIKDRMPPMIIHRRLSQRFAEISLKQAMENQPVMV